MVYPPQAVEDRGVGAHQRAPHQARCPRPFPIRPSIVLRTPRSLPRPLEKAESAAKIILQTTLGTMLLYGLAKFETDRFNPQLPPSSHAQPSGAPVPPKPTQYEKSGLALLLRPVHWYPSKDRSILFGLTCRRAIRRFGSDDLPGSDCSGPGKPR